MLCKFVGSEWVLEDTIHLKNIHLPKIRVDSHLDLSYLYDQSFLQSKQQRINNLMRAFSSTEDLESRSPLKNGEQNTPPILEPSSNLHKTGACLDEGCGCKLNHHKVTFFSPYSHFCVQMEWLEWVRAL